MFYQKDPAQHLNLSSDNCSVIWFPQQSNDPARNEAQHAVQINFSVSPLSILIKHRLRHLFDIMDIPSQFHALQLLRSMPPALVRMNSDRMDETAKCKPSPSVMRFNEVQATCKRDIIRTQYCLRGYLCLCNSSRKSVTAPQLPTYQPRPI